MSANYITSREIFPCFASSQITNLESELKKIKKKQIKLSETLEYIKTALTTPQKVNCLILTLRRTKDPLLDDTAVIQIRCKAVLHSFTCSINSMKTNDVCALACKVHNLSEQRRESLVRSMEKNREADAAEKNTYMMHKAKNFRIS